MKKKTKKLLKVIRFWIALVVFVGVGIITATNQSLEYLQWLGFNLTQQQSQTAAIVIMFVVFAWLSWEFISINYKYFSR